MDDAAGGGLYIASRAVIGRVQPPAQPEFAVDAGSASAKLAALPIKGRAPKTGYERSLFGQPWSDDVTVPDGHNGCDTRNDILRRDLVEVELKPGSHGCTVLTGY